MSGVFAAEVKFSTASPNVAGMSSSIWQSLVTWPTLFRLGTCFHVTWLRMSPWNLSPSDRPPLVVPLRVESDELSGCRLSGLVEPGSGDHADHGIAAGDGVIGQEDGRPASGR